MSTNRTTGHRIAESLDLIERMFPGMDWILGKGRIHPSEPLYGFRVFPPGDSDHVLAEGEHDDPIECVRLAAMDFDKGGKMPS